MAKRKKKKGRKLFFFGGSGTKSRKKSGKNKGDLTLLSLSTLKTLMVVGVLATFVLGFLYLDKYVKGAKPLNKRVGKLELVGYPEWINERLEKKIYESAISNGEDLTLDENAARSVQQNLIRKVVWLDKVRVQTTNESIQIIARWRRPIALVKLGVNKFYVDSEMVVLDCVPIEKLSIVEVAGLTVDSEIPQPGEVWNRGDLEAAVDILTRLHRMDELVTPEKPLLAEIDRIDVSNFNGRENPEGHHIILYANDNTEIIWGAGYGRWQRYMESPDNQKIAKLYQHYKQYGTLLGGVKYINLCDPQDNIPLPIDRYN